MSERPIVRVTWALTEAALDRLATAVPEVRLVAGPEGAPDLADADADRGAVALVGRAPADPASFPALRWLQVPSAGVEALPLAGWAERGVTVTNARGVYAVPIAQYVLGAILAVHERHAERRALQATGRWPDREEPYTGRPVRGETLGLLGYGGIGREVARLAAAHGMRVLAVKARPEVRADDGFRLEDTGDLDGTIPERIVGPDGLHEVASESAVLVITAPLTTASRGVVDRALLAAMRPDAWLVNIARGGLIDEDALLAALDAGRPAGAILDVFAEEPLPDGHPFWSHPRVVVTPHIAGGPSDEAFEALVTDNLRRWVAGLPLRNVVDPVRGY